MGKKLYRYWAAIFSISSLVILVIIFQLRTLHVVQKQEYEDLAKRIMRDSEKLSAYISNEILSIPLYFDVPLADSGTGGAIAFSRGYESFIQTAPYPNLLGKVYRVEKTNADNYAVLIFDFSKRQFEPTADDDNPFRVTRFSEFILAERNIRILMPDPENIFLVWPFSPDSIFVLTIPLQQVEQLLLAPSSKEYIEMPRMYDYSILNRNGNLLYTTGKATQKNFNKPHMILNLNLFGPPSPPDKGLAEPLHMPSIPRQGMSSMPNYLRELRRQQAYAETRNFPQMMFRDTGWRLIVTSKYSPFINFITAPSTVNLVLTICIIVLLSIALMYGIYSNKKYSEISQQQRLFLNSITHELRTPIASLLGAADNLGSGLVRDTTDIREYGQLISDEAKRLQTVIDSVLLFSGISSRQTIPEMREIQVRELFSAALAKFEGAFRAENFFIETILDSEGMTVYGNKALLVSMLENIIRNVQTHAFSGKFLGYGAYTTTRSGQNYTTLWIRDKGNGISKKEQKRIFTPFFRGKETVKKQIQGTGIGLYIASKICQLHRGIILCESKPGLGTTFSIMLPVVPKPQTGEGAKLE